MAYKTCVAGREQDLTLFYDIYLFYLGLTYISQYYDKRLGLVGRVLSRRQTLSGDGEERKGLCNLKLPDMGLPSLADRVVASKTNLKL